MDEELIGEFQEWDIHLQYGSPLLDRLRELAIQHELSVADLCGDWVAYSHRNGSCQLTEVTCESWAGQLAASSRHTSGGRQAGARRQQRRVRVHTSENLPELFDDDLVGQYGTQEDQENLQKRGVKRSLDQTTPTNHTAKARVTQNGATPTTPISQQRPLPTPLTTPGHNGALATTPAAKYGQRDNADTVLCSLNERGIPTDWRGAGRKVTVSHYDPERALTTPYHYMFQKVSDKALALMERTEQLGSAICQHDSLPDPLPISQPSLEPATYTGRVVCEGEGHLNARSCLLEGPVRSRQLHSHTVRLEIPDSTTCSLFPGQVIAVEGINNYSGTLIPDTIHHQGVYPPLPRRGGHTIGGFTMLAAAGPFSTTDSLDMRPLHDLLRVVEEEEPSVLLLLGPFVDVNHNLVKSCALPGQLTFQQFFSHSVLRPLLTCVSRMQTQLVLMPSQRDAHHPFEVYPQPPFHHSCAKGLLEKEAAGEVFFPDPSTLSVNDVCVGVTSTDILFHLSARTMFKGPSGDRMARLAAHILKQQCYYPLVPPYHKEEVSVPVKSEAGVGGEASEVHPPPSEPCEVNLDYIHAYEEGHAVLPVRPDVLLLPSDLKPFVKVLDGCVCVNPGHLTRKATGGTFVKLCIPELPSKPDITADVAVQIVHI